MGKTRFVLIGAGSHSFGPMMLKDLMQCPDFRGSQVVLVDLDSAKLDLMTRLAQRMNQHWGAEFEVSSTVDRREALPGATFVVVAVERRRWEMWRLDIEIPHKHGVRQYYGEVAGPGGMFHTFRQAPLLLEIAHDMEKLCPEAWLINMSNPESRLTLALHRYSRVKNVGVCLGAYITRHILAARYLGLKPDDVDIKVGGINHCHWALEVRHARTGEDLYPQVRQRAATVAAEDRAKGRATLSAECLRLFGYYPGPGDGHVGEFLGWGWNYLPEDCEAGIYRGDERAAELQAQLERLASGEAQMEDPGTVLPEGAMRWQSVDLMRSLVDNGNRYILSLNVPNQGYIPNLTQGAIVEVPTSVGADHIYGLPVGPLPAPIAAMMDLQLRIMDLVVDAAVTGNRQLALEALLIDPTVPGPQSAEKILDEMLLAQAELLPQFK